ncbi:unnamed protein product [Clonostachys rosea f. rosea IK726]|uniref:Uncharacterized protein n=1 Tax=Clonostachys rosea f. rosea IK726 TaxID=1349383 RepID=A0ACA9TWI1_BIOOC|nr:unnamed protein product [Clonostachys rosea f. rosea IK726]
MPTPSSLKHRESLSSSVYDDLPLADPDSVQLGEEASGVEGHVNGSGTTMSSDSNYLALDFDAGISEAEGESDMARTSLLLEPEAWPEERSRPLDCSWQRMTLIPPENPDAREILRLGKVCFITLQSTMRDRRSQRYGRRVLEFDVSVFRLAIARSDFYPEKLREAQDIAQQAREACFT